MNLQEKIEKRNQFLDDELVKDFNKVVNKFFLKKHKWFKHIDITKIGYFPNQNYFSPIGRIFIDSEWGAEQWRKYHYSSPIPESDEELSFGDIIGGDESQDLQNDFKLVFSFITGEKSTKYISFTWLEVYFIDESKKENQNLQEQIRRILKEETKSVFCECGWSWKLSEGGDDPYVCHKCGKDNSKKEITEKCWSGYTQKGMKTMFGKRYPNCVKKKK